MVYHGTCAIERIVVHPMNNLCETHVIELTKSADKPVFYVTCCCDSDWFYTFYMENNSIYERIKYNIMETIFECDDMDALMRILSEIFEDGFSDVMVLDDGDSYCK